jgi:hypothetical protein
MNFRGGEIERRESLRQGNSPVVVVAAGGSPSVEHSAPASPVSKEHAQEMDRACHRWLMRHDPEYRRERRKAALVRHALKKLIQTCRTLSTLSILKTITTPK